MTCDQVEKLLGPYLDNEMTDVLQLQEVEEHLETCEACRQHLLRLKAVSGAIRDRVPYFAAPGALESRIRAQIATPAVGARVLRLPALRGQLGYAATIAVLFSLLVFQSLRLQRTSLEENELVADHVRSLQANHLFDVASTDRHTVKPWFQGKLDFSPQVPNLASSGFPLLGGRLDYLEGGPVAALVYRRGKHVINVFVMHSESRVEAGENASGYHVVEWQTGGLEYLAVSDVNPADLDEFKTLFLSNAP